MDTLTPRHVSPGLSDLETTSSNSLTAEVRKHCTAFPMCEDWGLFHCSAGAAESELVHIPETRLCFTNLWLFPAPPPPIIKVEALRSYRALSASRYYCGAEWARFYHEAVSTTRCTVRNALGCCREPHRSGDVEPLSSRCSVQVHSLWVWLLRWPCDRMTQIIFPFLWTAEIFSGIFCFWGV